MISPQSQQVGRQLYKASWDSGLDRTIEVADIEKTRVEPIKLDGYLQACREYLDKEDLISEDSIRNIIDRIVNNAKLKIRLPAGQKCCIAVIPFTNFSYPLEQEDIENERYIRILLIDKDDLVEPGFYQNKNMVYKNLPVEIQKDLTFTIDQYENEDPYDVTDADRQKVRAHLESVFRRAREIFNAKKTAGKSKKAN